MRLGWSSLYSDGELQYGGRESSVALRATLSDRAMLFYYRAMFSSLFFLYYVAGANLVSRGQTLFARALIDWRLQAPALIISNR